LKYIHDALYQKQLLAAKPPFLRMMAEGYPSYKILSTVLWKHFLKIHFTNCIYSHSVSFSTKHCLVGYAIAKLFHISTLKWDASAMLEMQPNRKWLWRCTIVAFCSTSLVIFAWLTCTIAETIEKTAQRKGEQKTEYIFPANLLCIVLQARRLSVPIYKVLARPGAESSSLPAQEGIHTNHQARSQVLGLGGKVHF